MGNLAGLGATHYLSYGLDNVPKSAGPAHRLPSGKLSAVGVDGEATLVGGVHFIKEGTNFALFAEPGIFEAHGLKDGVSIIELG